VKAYKPYLDELDLTYTQYITMMVMWEYKELRVKEVGKYLYLDSGTLTPLLKRLEEKGYITRRRSEKDERDLIVMITEKGEELKEKAADVPQKVGKCVGIEPQKAQTLYALLYEILGKLTER
ncbi:MAG: MarR family transcriptional regulator, partial [Oscillospiraceae bacterium]|nr:MarR family transcriptional regulator [Oscillospiraceae bacterium]